MTVNNEIGSIQPIKEIVKTIRHFRSTKKDSSAFNFQDYLLQRTMKIFHGMHETEAGALFAKKIVSKNSQILKNYHRELISRELEEIALRWYFPPVFVKEAGMENILQKLPQQGILRPAVSKILLTQFYYRYGLMADETLFTVYLNQLSSGKITLPTVDEILKPRGINFVYEEGLQKGLTPVSK
jgi:hypothetical protein